MEVELVELLIRTVAEQPGAAIWDRREGERGSRVVLCEHGKDCVAVRIVPLHVGELGDDSIGDIAADPFSRDVLVGAWCVVEYPRKGAWKLHARSTRDVITH